MGASERTFIIYCHTAPNGKRYIGQTCQKPNARWCYGKGYKNNEYFTRAINKYGWENFKHEILCVVHYKSVANLFEQHYIAKFDTFNSDHGYNLTKGGGGRVGYKMSEKECEELGNRMRGREVSEETRKRISDVLKEGYRTGRIQIKKHSKEAMEKMSRERIGKGNPMYGRHHTPEAIASMTAKRTGKKRSEETRRRISEARYKSDKIPRRPVSQFDLNGNFIASYPSIKAASESIGHATTGINSCCRGKRKQAYGFIWCYQDHPETFPSTQAAR